MSTLQERATLAITNTNNNLLNCFERSDKARNTVTENNCEEKVNKKENSENSGCFLSVTKKGFINDNTQRKSTFQTFADLIVDAQRPSAVDENPLKILSEDKDNFDNRPIDIKPSILRPENFGYTQAHLARRFSDFVKSLCILCDICDNQHTERVIRLNRQETIVAALLLRKSFGIGIKTKKIFPNKLPKQSCGNCFKKIILFHQRFKSQRKIKKEFTQDMDQPPHGYQCQCLTCQNQYGSLPVLLKGIEEQNKMQSSEILLGEYHQETTNVTICQPQMTFQSQVDIVTCQMQPQISFQDQLFKFEEDYKPFQSQQQGHFQTSVISSQGYTPFLGSQVQTETNYPVTSKTELYLEQSRSDYQATVGDQSQSGSSYPGRSQYYESSNVNQDPTILSSSSYTQDQHLPTLLQDLERTCEVDITNQPSTSSGLQGQPWTQDEKHSKKTMTCEHCNKSFTHKGDFNKHLRKHTKEKPYNCAYCDKSFSHTSNLHRHQRIHSGDRPFQCQYCDKRFSRKDKLESHKNSKSCKTKQSWK